MNEETIEKIISKHKLYMSMDGYEYEAITKVDLYKLIEEIERLNSIIKGVREIFKYYGNKEDIVGYANYTITGESLLELLEILDKEGK